MTAQQMHDLRNRLGMTLAQMSEILGVTGMAISKWERGEATPGPYKQAALERLRDRLSEAENRQQREKLKQQLQAATLQSGVGGLLHVLFRADDELAEWGYR